MNLNDYEMFVNSKTSDQSSRFKDMIEELQKLHDDGDKIGVRIPELITASVGLSAEAGEFTEIVKKMMFQGKPLNEENKIHLKKELGDIMFYVMIACTALGATGEEIIDMNVDKLSNRYKDGFTVSESENRVDGDI